MWWRIDDAAYADWDWTPFDEARHRFDPPSGRFRVRYGANSPVAAARERFQTRRIAEPHGDLCLVRMEGPPSALHLTHQVNLDVLQLDDRINTGRLDEPIGPNGDPLLNVSQRLSDAVFDWWKGQPPPVAYRTRTLPVARSMAFTSSVGWDGPVESRSLREAVGLLVELVVVHGFDVPAHWL